MDIIDNYRATVLGTASNSTQRKEHIVLLLGAGFSIDQGYPLAKNVGEGLLSLRKNNISFMPDGTLSYSNTIQKDTQEVCIRDTDYFQKIYLFLLDLIDTYAEIKRDSYFDYEEFYDAINLSVRNRINTKGLIFNILDEKYQNLASKYTDDFLTFEQLILRTPIMYNQIIAELIKQKGNNDYYYDDVDITANCLPSYTNFISWLKKESASDIIDVFTLNHDLFFESFKKVTELKDEKNAKSLISDGYDDYGSDFFGVLEKDNTSYCCRLERFTGRHNTPIRLYKLHGSLDYVLCYKIAKCSQGLLAMPLKYIKTKRGLLPFEYYKSTRNKMKYESCLTDFSQSFLSGTISKTMHYSESYYRKLFDKFARCLQNTDRLVIIGYSGNDEIINKYLINHFNGKEKKCTIIDYAPEKPLNNLASKLNAQILKGKINEQIVHV